MSKTLTPEEFEAENSIVDKMPVEYLTKWEFAEAYANYLHKAKVESVTNENITDAFELSWIFKDRPIAKEIELGKIQQIWFIIKQKLLEQ